MKRVVIILLGMAMLVATIVLAIAFPITFVNAMTIMGISTIVLLAIFLLLKGVIK